MPTSRHGNTALLGAVQGGYADTVQVAVPSHIPRPSPWLTFGRIRTPSTAAPAAMHLAPVPLHVPCRTRTPYHHRYAPVPLHVPCRTRALVSVLLRQVLVQHGAELEDQSQGQA